MIVPDSETQFDSVAMIEFYKNLGIQTKSILVKHPQINGQAKSTNKIIISDMRKKLDEATKTLVRAIS